MDPKPTKSGAYIHSGVVSRIESHSIVVSLDGDVACESCRAKALCGVSDTAVKEVEVSAPNTPVRLNQPVKVILEKDLGWKAVFWAYMFPFLLMMATLVTGSLILDEWLAGILSVMVLVPYYLGVYALRDYFKKTFRISLVSTL